MSGDMIDVDDDSGFPLTEAGGVRREVVLALLLAVSCALVAYGVALVSLPASLIVGGVLLAALAVVVVGDVA